MLAYLRASRMHAWQLQRQTGNEKRIIIFKDILVLKYSFALVDSNSESGPLKQILSIRLLASTDQALAPRALHNTLQKTKIQMPWLTHTTPMRHEKGTFNAYDTESNSSIHLFFCQKIRSAKHFTSLQGKAMPVQRQSGIKKKIYCV